MLNHLFGREQEIRRLQNCLKEERAQLVILYGRRRVGKTFLVDETFSGRFDFKLTGAYKEKKEVQLQHFTEELSLQTGTDIPTPKDWTSAFYLLRRYLSALPKSEKHIVFFDEMPWLDTQRSGFLAAFEYFWNSFGCALHNLVCIVSGSASTWMLKNIAQNQGGLFNRQTCTIYLRPFTLKETEAYLKFRGIEWSRYDITECYMIMGGIPHYLSLLEPERSLSDNIDNLFFRKRAELWNEFQLLYRTLFNNSAQYIQIVEALSKKRIGLTRNEIIEATGLQDNGALTEMLQNLVLSDFVRASARFGQKNNVYYQLCDYYSMFYFRFIQNRPGRDEHYWIHSYGSPSKNAWAGLTFEMVCRDHISQIKSKIGIAAVLTEESAWSVKASKEEAGAQIDLVIDRKDHTVNLCEIKYSEKAFAIDKDYDQDLRNKRETFREKTKTNKTLQLVMISTYGLRQNQYASLISAQVTMDDLFAL